MVHVWYLLWVSDKQNKWKTWELIKSILLGMVRAWLLFGDLNDIVTSHEKNGGNTKSYSQLFLGRQTLSDTNLVDLGYEGYPFTWSNGRKGEDNIQAKLDRALGNSSFLNRFSHIKVTHLPRFRSDHAVILIHLEAH